MLLASCYGHLGRAEDARITWAELLKVNPDFSLNQRARVLPYKDPADFQRIAEGFGQSRVAVAAFFDELGRASSQCRSDRPSAAAAMVSSALLLTVAVTIHLVVWNLPA
jgi:hypothetical protein